MGVLNCEGTDCTACYVGKQLAHSRAEKKLAQRESGRGGQIGEQGSDKAWPGGPGESGVYLKSNGETTEGYLEGKRHNQICDWNTASLWRRMEWKETWWVQEPGRRLSRCPDES